MFITVEKNIAKHPAFSIIDGMKTVFLLALVSLFVLPLGVYAADCGQTCPPGQICLQNPLKACSFTDLIDNILTFLFNIAIVVLPIMVVFAGFMFLTAGGNPSQVGKARDLLLWTMVGFGVILLARGLTEVLRKIIGF